MYVTKNIDFEAKLAAIQAVKSSGTDNKAMINAYVGTFKVDEVPILFAAARAA